MSPVYIAISYVWIYIYVIYRYVYRRHIVMKNQCNKSVSERSVVPDQGFIHLHGRKKETVSENMILKS